jgi:pyruvate formate lyase activating enzyme
MTNTCKICGTKDPPVAEILGVCGDCILGDWDRAKDFVEKAHRVSRREFGFSSREELQDMDGEKRVPCYQCVNSCKIPPGKTGFCVVKENRQQRLFQKAGTRETGYVDYYYDPLPTNCVAAWACGEKERWDYRTKLIIPGYLRENNLAVFYQSCTFDCLYCQNWHFRTDLKNPRKMSASELAEAINDKTRCVCYFGGDPASQMGHCISASREIVEKTGGKVRICWETNGSAKPSIMKKAADIALQTGGTIKFDLKAFSPEIHYALTGCSNENTLENFRMVSEMGKARREPPLVCAATLLVPGYVSLEEAKKIAGFIASIDPDTPYSLLAFYASYLFPDLPSTSQEHAEKAEEISRKQGLSRIHVGNIHVLSRETYAL